MDRAPQIDVGHPAPIVVRHLRDWARDNNAGVAEYDIDMAEQAESLVREVNHLIEMPDVAHHPVRVKPVGVQPRHSLFESRLIDVREHDACSAPGELGGSGQTDATRTAGDDRPASLKRVHRIAVSTSEGRTSTCWDQLSLWSPTSRRWAGLKGGYFRQPPASTGRVTPVT